MAQGVSYTIVQRINERDYHQHWKSSHQTAVLGTPVLSPSVMESGWWASLLVLYRIISGQHHCPLEPLEHPLWLAGALMYYRTSASINLETPHLFFPPKFVTALKNKYATRVTGTTLSGRPLFQDLISSAQKENQREKPISYTLHHTQKAQLCPSPRKDASLFDVARKCIEARKAQDQPEYLLYFPSRDCRCGQNQNMAFISGF